MKNRIKKENITMQDLDKQNFKNRRAVLLQGCELRDWGFIGPMD